MRNKKHINKMKKRISNNGAIPHQLNEEVYTTDKPKEKIKHGRR